MMTEINEFASCLEKQAAMRARFATCETPEQVYNKIIEMGREQVPLEAQWRSDEYKVRGCQSTMYLKVEEKNGKLFFSSESDALISAGLGQLLVQVYSDEPAEAVIKCAPTYLKDLGIVASLTPGRANGLASLFTKMQAAAIESYKNRSD